MVNLGKRGLILEISDMFIISNLIKDFEVFHWNWIDINLSYLDANIRFVDNGLFKHTSDLYWEQEWSP